jgi:hypothetical protein
MFLINHRLRRSHDKLQDLLLRARLKVKPYYTYSVNNPKWLFMFLFSRFQVIRSHIQIFYPKAFIEDCSESIFEKLDVETVVQALQKDGLYLGIQLPPTIIEEIVAFTMRKPCYANLNPQLMFHIDSKELWQEEYSSFFIVSDYVDPERHCYAIEKITQDPKLLKIAATYFNAKPVFTGSRLWWSFATNANFQERLNFAQELFHYDPIDYRSLKFFFYLTEVDVSTGPHVCVRGSHKNKKITHQLTFFIGRSDHDISQYYQQKDILTICGNVGFGFAEDPFCFHKGTPPQQRDRLMLQIEYCLNNYHF